MLFVATYTFYSPTLLRYFLMMPRNIICGLLLLLLLCSLCFFHLLAGGLAKKKRGEEQFYDEVIFSSFSFSLGRNVVRFSWRLSSRRRFPAAACEWNGLKTKKHHTHSFFLIHWDSILNRPMFVDLGGWSGALKLGLYCLPEPNRSIGGNR